MLTTHNCILKSKTMTVTLLCLRSCFLLLYTRFSTTAVYPLSPGKARSQWQATLSLHHFGSKIAVSSKIQSLDVTPGSSFTFSTYVTNICKKSHFHITDLRHIRKYLTEYDAKTVASALSVLSLTTATLSSSGFSKPTPES